MTRAWLIRHGEPEEKARNLCYGSLNLGLSDTGRSQMSQVAEYLKNEPIANIYCSPRARALESSALLAAGTSRPLHVTPELAEMNFGDFEGLSYDEIAARYPDAYREWMNTPTKVQFPNGGSFAEMRTRVLQAFHTLIDSNRDLTIALVSHGGVNRILIAWALQMPDDCLFRLAQHHAAVNLLEFSEGVPSVQMLNGLRQ
jgi:alpha-ribazole phosphatase/probable phosphoglycerate mutase